MQAIGPLKTTSPAHTGALVAHYFEWIDGKRPDPPAPPRPIGAALQRAISEQPASSSAGMGATKNRRRCICISIEDARTPRHMPGSNAPAARAASRNPAGTTPQQIPSSASSTTTTAAAPAGITVAVTRDTPPAPGNPNRIITRGPNDRPLYAGWMLAALDQAREIFTHPETFPPALKP